MEHAAAMQETLYEEMTGCYRRYKEKAQEYAFMVDLAGIER